MQKPKKPLLYGAALAFALAWMAPGAAFAAESATSENAPQEKTEAKESEDAAKEEIPLALIEVKDTKEKEPTPLRIGQTPQAEGITNYVVTRTSTGSKSDVASKYLPQSISVVSQKILEEQRVKNPEQALSNVAGISNGGGRISLNSIYQSQRSLSISNQRIDRH